MYTLPRVEVLLSTLRRNPLHAFKLLEASSWKLAAQSIHSFDILVGLKTVNFLFLAFCDLIEISLFLFFV